MNVESQNHIARSSRGMRLGMRNRGVEQEERGSHNMYEVFGWSGGVCSQLLGRTKLYILGEGRRQLVTRP